MKSNIITILKNRLRRLRKVVVYRVEMPLDKKISLSASVKEALPNERIDVRYTIGISDDGLPYMCDILITKSPSPRTQVFERKE